MNSAHFSLQSTSTAWAMLAELLTLSPMSVLTGHSGPVRSRGGKGSKIFCASSFESQPDCKFTPGLSAAKREWCVFTLDVDANGLPEKIKIGIVTVLNKTFDIKN